MELVLIPAIIATVELLRRAQARDYFACLTILVCAAIGVILGLTEAPGVNSVWEGLVGALAASGVITVATRVSTSSSVDGTVK